MEKVERPLAVMRALNVGESKSFPMTQRQSIATMVYYEKWNTGQQYTLKKKRGEDTFTVTRIK